MARPPTIGAPPLIDESNNPDSAAHAVDSESRAKNEASAWRPTTLVSVWCVVLLVYILIMISGKASYRTVMVINDVAWTVAAALAAISCFRAARPLRGRDRTAWLIFAAAAAAWTAGQIVWDVYELILNASTFPSYADVGYLAFGPLMIAGLFVLRATQEERGLTWLRVANLGLILCSLTVVLIVTLGQPFDVSKRSLSSSLIVVGENASITLAFIVAIYFLWSYRWGKRLVPYTLLTLSIGMQMISGLLYTRELIADEYGATSFFNIGWIVAFALQQWAAESQLRARRRVDEVTARSVQQAHGWVEALVPSFLVLCIAMTSVLLADEITSETIYLGAAVLGAFAVILGLREGWLFSQGQHLRSALDSAAWDLTRAREQLRAVATQRTELERIIDVTARAGSVGLWNWDLHSNTVSYSREWKRQLGYEEHELADAFREWDRRLHPDDRTRVRATLAKYLDNPQGEYASEQRLLHRDGSYRWIFAQGSVVLDEHGRPARMLGSHVDITAFKQLELSLRESEARYRELVDALESRVAERTQELSAAYRESQNFAYAVAHDLKAPLRAIDGFSALLHESAGDRLNAVEHGYIERARQGALRMSVLIDGLLDYSRVEHREQRIDAIDCKEFIAELVQSMSDVIQETHAQVIVNVEQTRVLADREGLRIVLANLLGNALKFSRTSPAPRIEISSSCDAATCVIQVRDNGIGFDPAYHDKIFEIFHRLHPSGYEGTGIGLALVRKAVQRMHGQVWAESVTGKGATFFVRLPSAEGPASVGG